MIDYTTIKPVEDEDTLRDLAACLAIYACTDDTMVSAMQTPLTSELYREITLDLWRASIKQKWKQPFSGCAFLCHWMLECLGYKVAGIGRQAKADNPLSRLAYHPLSHQVSPSTMFESGDIIQIGDGELAHVYISLAANEGKRILGAHYGQEGLVDDDGVKIGGKLRELAVKRVGLAQFHGNRPARRVLPLVSFIEEYGYRPCRIPTHLSEWLKVNAIIPGLKGLF